MISSVDFRPGSESAKRPTVCRPTPFTVQNVPRRSDGVIARPFATVYGSPLTCWWTKEHHRLPTLLFGRHSTISCNAPLAPLLVATTRHSGSLPPRLAAFAESPFQSRCRATLPADMANADCMRPQLARSCLFSDPSTVAIESQGGEREDDCCPENQRKVRGKKEWHPYEDPSL
ncbi:hypothetical protein PYCCODRAFT_730222 [Trametes coccinea BRFM310]|uniref:Uncharacterized protein n=1 Tax=Trametes coccinea (strain BRFM310) TaxID=1353009 RepID=A0A1Y2IFY4_TRAC3|nr:hypothetical protein PYCCODRAFT_730222 [Trametes coccinea BRFM310]